MSEEDSFENTVYVGGLKDATSPDFRQCFYKYGVVLGAEHEVDEMYNRTGMAFVKFGNKSEQESALKANGTEFDGKTISVSEVTVESIKKHLRGGNRGRGGFRGRGSRGRGRGGRGGGYEGQ